MWTHESKQHKEICSLGIWIKKFMALWFKVSCLRLSCCRIWLYHSFENSSLMLLLGLFAISVTVGMIWLWDVVAEDWHSHDLPVPVGTDKGFSVIRIFDFSTFIYLWSFRLSFYIIINIHSDLLFQEFLIRIVLVRWHD